MPVIRTGKVQRSAMKQPKLLLWEEHGVSIEDYARAFNKVLNEAFERCVGKDMYLVIDKPLTVRRITNIRVGGKG